MSETQVARWIAMAPRASANRDWFGRLAGRWSLARQLFVLQIVVVTAVVAAGAGLAWYNAQNRTQEEASGEVVAIARTLAAQPAVRSAMGTPDAAATLQPLAEAVRANTGVAFVTIMNPEGIRYTHPNPGRIGEPFVGNIAGARAGGLVTETYTGTLGPSVRAVTPVFGRDGEVRGMVAVGIAVRVVTAELRKEVTALVLVALSALLLGAMATYLVGARLRRYTRGLRPAELSRMYEYHDAILHAVHEGLLLVSPSGELTMCNDGAAVLLSLDSAEAEGAPVAELGLPGPLVGALVSGTPVRDEVHLTDDRVLLVNVSPVRSANRDLGSVVTLRDHTELRALSGELDSLRGFAESLRSQAHESANRLHAVVSLIELGRTEEAVAFATEELALAQQLTDRVVGAVSEPVLAAVLLGKIAEARERGVEVVLGEGTEVEERHIAHVEPRDLVTIVGNLVDNAVEALQGEGAGRPAPRVVVTARSSAEGLLIRVADNGPGLDATSTGRVFERGWSTKQDGRGLGLALVGQSVRRYGGAVEISDEGGAVFTAWLPGESS